jgi:hypothetical protein
MDLAHGEIEIHVLLASREIARRMLQAHFDLRARQERQAPRPPQVVADAVPRAHSCNLDTVVGRVRVTRWAWQRPRKPTVRPLDAAIDLPREVHSSGVRRFVCEQFADRSVGRCTEALSTLGIEVPRRQSEQLAARMARDFDAFYADRGVRPTTPSPTRPCWCSRPTPRAFGCCRGRSPRGHPQGRRPRGRRRRPRRPDGGP